MVARKSGIPSIYVSFFFKAVSVSSFSYYTYSIMEWKRKRLPGLRIRSSLLYCVPIFFFSFCAVFFSSFPPTAACLEINSRLSAGKAGLHFQEFHGRRNHHKLETTTSNIMESTPRGGRRFLGGPGSSPPRCASKCGKCTPCKPVHVPVPPGTPVTAEYYPEAWRCKCGNKLYMP